MIPFDEALRLVAHVAKPLRRETLPLSEVAGRVLAQPVLAAIDSPRFDCSTMDGYAVRDADIPATLRVVGNSYPGAEFGAPIGPGECVRVFTGGPVPAGTDRVVIQENVTRESDVATIASPGTGERFVRAKGSDFRTGDTLLEPGALLTPGAIVAAAGADQAAVSVWARPRVAVLATGDELAEPGVARHSAAKVPDSISPGLAALAQQWGAEVIAVRRLRDDLPALEDASGDALAAADLVVVTGGASVGVKDLAKAMFAGHELELLFSKVAMRPGKPVWLGRAGGRLVMGLPGNPTSALVTARLLLAPLLAGLSGREAGHDWREMPLAGPLPACGDRETFVRARRSEGGAVPLENQDSGAQHPLARADLLLRCPPFSMEKASGETILALDLWSPQHQ
jgi:molybdopterin molybdotransferase